MRSVATFAELKARNRLFSGSGVSLEAATRSRSKSFLPLLYSMAVFWENGSWRSVSVMPIFWAACCTNSATRWSVGVESSSVAFVPDAPAAWISDLALSRSLAYAGRAA